MGPKITAIIPSFNRADTLPRAIESVLAQEKYSIETIVVDDGSTDQSSALLRKYGSRIKIITQERLGAAAARNRGIEAAQGELIAFLDSDDEWLPEKTRIQVPEFDSDPLIGIVASGALFVENERVYDIHWTPKRRSLTEKLLSATINTSGVMIRTRYLRALDVYFRSDLPIYEDSELWWRIAARHKSVMLPDILVKSHRLDTSVSTSISMEDRIQSVETFYRYVLGDEPVRQMVGRKMNSFLAQRHYIASCAYYINRQYLSAFTHLLTGLKEDPFDAKWLKLAGVISTPPALRPIIKRWLKRIAQYGR